MFTEYHNNPFIITTPEDLTADETVKLFVDVYSDFFNVINPGNVIIKGPRGVGKSMMLRYLEPDCQILQKNKSIGELKFIAVYVPLRNTNFAIAEFQRFEDRHAFAILNEHMMILHCLIKVFDCLKNEKIASGLAGDKLYDFYVNDFASILLLKADETISKTPELILNKIVDELTTLYKSLLRYLKACTFPAQIAPYTGELYDYNDYFVPLIHQLSKSITNLENPPTFYLMLDDAQYLSEIQTRILNSWIASRASRKISLKVSTQYSYKSYYTLNGAPIDTPHDYIEVDMATIYTINNNTYYKRIEEIVKKRLELIGIESSPQSFFPVNQKQEDKIKEIAKSYKIRFDEGQGRGNRRSDDATRYARPDYIKSLGGTSKSTSKYSYAGFDQLVNISSGVVRTFLQQAHEMYAKQLSINNGLDNDKKINYIDQSIQNKVVRSYAENIIFKQIESYSISGGEGAYPKEDIDRLINLINGLGGIFRAILTSDRSERKVFSIAISDKPSELVLQILNIGIQIGYFHKSTIGRKESGSIGRTNLYVLNRVLAPVWNLDPNGFAHYLFLQNQVLENLMDNPIKTIKRFQDSKIAKANVPESQITIFELYPEINNEDEEQ